jgi:superfamily I DNA/RNA helicase
MLPLKEYSIIYYCHNNPTFCDSTAREEAETCERALLYVAVTRAKKEVLITSYGEKSEFLKAGFV